MSTRDEKVGALHDLRARVHRVRYAKKMDTKVWEATWRAKSRWEKRWQRWGEEVLNNLGSRVDVEDLIRYATQAQKSRIRRVRKDDNQDALIASLIERVTSGIDQSTWVEGAATSYLQIALDTGETAGQYGLDSLGINKTFAWANPRNMAADLYAVRGSKVVQGMYGNHIANLTKLIVDATNPAQPLAMSEIVRQIREDYPNLLRWQAEQIARTETAAVWENMNMNMMIANEVPGANVLVATGPSIGTITMSVCSICKGIVADGPWFPASAAPTPPFHPNCRCTVVAELTNDNGDPWLPPADTWNGGEFADLIPLAAPGVA